MIYGIGNPGPNLEQAQKCSGVKWVIGIPITQWSGKRKWLWAIVAPSSQHSMGHFSVVFVKTKIFYGPFNSCMGHLHRITKLYVSNGLWPLPVCIKRPMAPACMYQTAHGPCLYVSNGPWPLPVCIKWPMAPACMYQTPMAPACNQTAHGPFLSQSLITLPLLTIGSPTAIQI